MSAHETVIEHTQESYGLRPQASAYPMMLVLSFVYPCNAKCPHCPYTNSNIRKSYRDAPTMPEAIFKKIADESGPHGAFLRISGGGETMLHEQAVELLTYAKEKGCKIGLITNGSLFNEENSRALLKAGVDMIEFSVDASSAEEYAEVRVGLNWNILVDNVRRMLDLRKSLNSTSRIITSGVNQKATVIERAERFWMEDVGVDYFIKRKFLTWGANTTLNDSKSGDCDPYIDIERVPCPFIFERLNIDSRGNVMVCGFDIAANTSMGNITRESIRDIWLGAGFEHYRQRHLANLGRELPLCAGCPDWKYRSWKHNYWKVVEGARNNHERKRVGLNIHDDFQSASEEK